MKQTAFTSHSQELEASILRRRQLARLLGISVPTLDRWRAAGTLPEPVKFPSGTVGWRLSTIREWLAELEGGTP